MIDFVVSGSRGFIGRQLMERLQTAGYSVMSDREFANSQQQAGTFVNCANIADSPSQNLALLESKIALADQRCARFVQLQSFSTLVGSGRLSLDEPNCGLRPHVMNMYSAGKFEQERLLSRHAQRGFVPSVLLVYLPVVLGKGGSWSAAIAQSQRHGFLLPQPMPETARANWVDVADIAAFLIDAHTEASAAGLRRVILNRPESESTTWPDLLGGAALAPAGASAKAELKEWAVAGAMRAIAMLSRLGLLVPLDGLLRRVLRAGDSAPKHTTAIPNEPLVFRSLMKTIARQPYVPSTSVPARPQFVPRSAAR
jgi:nucleoside-diphosphate-sugar epimerase